MATSSLLKKKNFLLCLVLLPVLCLYLPPQPAESKPAAPKSQKRAEDNGPATLRRADFVVVGVSCLACIRRIERGLRQSEGVLKAEIDAQTPHRAILFYDESKTSPEKVWARYEPEHVSMTQLKVSKVTEVPKKDFFYTPMPPAQADTDHFGMPDVPVPGVH